MRIKLINPNTTASMTELMGLAARAVAGLETEVILATSRSGAPSIEGHYDEAMSIVGLVELVREPPYADAYVVACFGDPGLLAARELTASPVVGIAEAAMHAATFVAKSFSVVTTLPRTRAIAEHLVLSYGMQNHCRGVRATDIPVLDVGRLEAATQTKILYECERALNEDGSEAIVLGCGGMTYLARFLEDRLQVPVIDGVAAAIKFAEAIVGMGLRTSKAGSLAYPLPKAYKGSLAGYSPEKQASPGDGYGVRSIEVSIR